MSVPNVARIYDYWLGGKDNFAADREAADRQARAVPQLPWLARQNREFLRHPAPVPRRRELEQAVKAFRRVPARTRAEIAGFFGDLTLVEPGLTDIWAWRPDGDTVPHHHRFHADPRRGGPEELTAGWPLTL